MGYYGIELDAEDLKEVEFEVLESGDIFHYEGDTITYMKIYPEDVQNYNTVCITHGTDSPNIKGHMFHTDDRAKVYPLKAKLVILR